MPLNADHSEIQPVTLFRSRSKILCPGVRVVGIPNGGKRSQWAAAQAKREGMATGFVDLIALAPGKIAFLEIKTARGKLSVAPEEWQERLKAMDFPCGVFRSANSALDFLREHDFPFIFEGQENV